MKKTLELVWGLVLLPLVMLACFYSVSFAAGTATAAANGEPTILDLLRPVYDAFRGGHYVAGGALALVLAVALIKRYAPGKVGEFVHSDAGGVIAALAISFGSTVAAYTADGQAWTWSIAWTAGGVAFAAAGSYAMIKKLLVEPLLASKWWSEKAPAWLKAIAQVVLWVFDKPAAGELEIAKAEKAGNDAVQASPSPGAAKIAGEPEKF